MDDIKKQEATIARLEKKLKKPMATLERMGMQMTLDAAKRNLDDMRNNR